MWPVLTRGPQEHHRLSQWTVSVTFINVQKEQQKRQARTDENSDTAAVCVDLLSSRSSSVGVWLILSSSFKTGS